MAFELTIEFRGLCAFVPSKALVKGTELPRTLTTLLVDARGHRLASDDVLIRPHTPCLAYRREQWDLQYTFAEAETPDPDDQTKLCEPKTNGQPRCDEHGLLLLSAEDLYVRGTRTNGVEIHSEKIAQIGKIAESYGRIEQKYLTAAPLGVAARLHLTSGSLGAVENTAYPWSFKKLVPPDAPHSESRVDLAFLTAATVSVPAEPATIVSYSMGAAPRLLWSLRSKQSDKATVVLFNFERSMLTSYKDLYIVYGAPDRDFEVFYDLCAEPNPPRLVPVSVYDPGRAPRCMSALFDPA